MATRFAISAGNFSNGAIWDNGSVPTSSDDIYANGFAIAVDQNITALTLRSTTSNVYLPNMAIPAMTGNTTPSGVAFASSNATGFEAYKAFDQINTNPNYWQSGVTNTGIVGYQFTSGKVIKRYYVGSLGGAQFVPKTFTFEGSNDGTTYTVLETVTTNTLANYVSPVLANTTSYTYYRLNITAVGTVGNAATVWAFEMTESTATTYGTGTGGSFDVSVARDITLSGNPALFTATTTTGTINITATTGTVNVTASSGNLTNLNSGQGRGIYVNGTATVNITGSCLQGTTGITSAIITNSTGIINYTGNITSGAQGSNSSYVITITSICTFNIIGNINGHSLGSGTLQHYPINISANATVNITGNLTSFLGYALAGGGTVNITGNITSSGANCLNVTGNVNVPTGIITASSSGNGISNSGSGLVTIGNSPLINTSNVMAVNAVKVRLYSPASIQWVFQNNLGANKTLYSAGGSIGLPLTTDVRSGVVYGASNELTGTMVVATNPNVRIGVPVDVSPNVGTADLTAEDLFNAIAVSPNPVAERLRNVSTIQTTGDQLAAF